MFSSRAIIARNWQRGASIFNNNESVVLRVFGVTKYGLMRPSLFTMTAKRSYHENVIDHYEKPRNVGSLNSEDGTVGTGLVGAPA